MTLSRIPVLLYHSIDSKPDPWIAPWTIPPSLFALHLDAMAEMGCSPMTIAELVSARQDNEPLPINPVVVTFDDGFANFATEAAPLLIARQIPSTLYMTTGMLRSQRSEWTLRIPKSKMLSCTQIIELAGMGVEIGAHSHTHPQLDTIPAEQAKREIDISKDTLEQILQREVASFAYPHGYFDSKVREIVVAAGYRSACAVQNALSDERENLYALSRLTIRNDISLELFQSWIMGKHAKTTRVLQTYRSSMWRLYRRTRSRAMQKSPQGTEMSQAPMT